MKVGQFNLPELIQRQRGSGRAWQAFLDIPSLSMGVYHVPAGTSDRETHDPHDRDEVYLVVEGTGRLNVDGHDHEMKEGEIVFVKAGVAHHFHNVERDLSLLVFFSAPVD